MRRIAIVGIACLVAGCGAPADPATSRLAKGQAALVVGSKPVHLWLPGHENDPISEQMELVPVGSKAVIDRDEEESETGELEGDRDVWVSVMDGPQAGKAGTIKRKDLRAAASPD